MIDPQWDVSDLDPVTWRNIGRYLPPGQYIRAGKPGEHALFVLHDAGRVLNVVDTNSGRRADLALDEVANPAKLADELHQRGEWDRVHVIDKNHLAAVSHELQSDALEGRPAVDRDRSDIPGRQRPKRHLRRRRSRVGGEQP